jgi:signal transduction histidine kinase
VEISIIGIQGKVRISVKDQGPGLTEQDQTNLFKKFQRLSNRPTNGESSIGLGLAIVKRYTEMMGGRVWCESEPGMGAAFNLEFDEVV